MKSVTADTLIWPLLQAVPPAKAVLDRYHMLCDNCMGLEHETVAGAARRHEVDLARFLAELNETVDLYRGGAAV